MIFAVGDPSARRHFRGDMPLPEVRALNTPFRLLRGEWQPPGELHASHRMGAAEPGDVVWTTYVGPLVVSERVIDILHANAFTGWRTYPVVVQNKAKAVVPGYHGLAFVGRCGPLDGSRSRVVLRDYPALLKEQRVGYHFDEASWDGSDFFCSTEGSAVILCTAEVKRVLERAKVSNLLFEPISDMTVLDEAILKTLPPLARIPKVPGVRQPY